MFYCGVGKITSIHQGRVGRQLCYCLLQLTSKFPPTTKFSTLVNNASLSENKLKMNNRNLAAFDFDHTIVDDNTDIVVRNLISKDAIPASIKQLYKEDGWTAYMQGIFELLHAHGQNEESIASALNDIPATLGMPELIKELSEGLNYDVIIISDSNSYLIDTWLEKHRLKDNIREVFTNPAQFLKGVLTVKMYHLQEHCKLSTKNLCKGQILEEFIQRQKESGVIYDKVIYAGDGANDFCPILRLRTSDLACVRENYSCVKIVKSVLNGNPVPSTGKTYDIKAKLLTWNTGFDILNVVKNPNLELSEL